MERQNIIRNWARKGISNQAYASLRDEGYRGILIRDYEVVAVRPEPCFVTVEILGLFDGQGLSVLIKEKLIGMADIKRGRFSYHTYGLLLDNPIDYGYWRQNELRDNKPELERCRAAINLVSAKRKKRFMIQEIANYATAQSGLPLIFLSHCYDGMGYDDPARIALLNHELFNVDSKYKCRLVKHEDERR